MLRPKKAARSCCAETRAEADFNATGQGDTGGIQQDVDHGEVIKDYLTVDQFFYPRPARDTQTPG